MAALLVCSSSSYSSRHFFINPSSSNNPKTLSIIIRCQDSNSSDPSESTSTVSPPSSSGGVAAGSGFGSATTNSVNSKKKQQGKKERASVIRRTPLGKPNFESPRGVDLQDKEKSQNESAFLLAWTGLGAIIILEGILLAASGFLPEEWDTFFVKYLYPSYTPTVFLFLAGTVAYGVLKYLQNEKTQE